MTTKRSLNGIATYKSYQILSRAGLYSKYTFSKLVGEMKISFIALCRTMAFDARVHVYVVLLLLHRWVSADRLSVMQMDPTNFGLDDQERRRRRRRRRTCFLACSSVDLACLDVHLQGISMETYRSMSPLHKFLDVPIIAKELPRPFVEPLCAPCRAELNSTSTGSQGVMSIGPRLSVCTAQPNLWDSGQLLFGLLPRN